MVLSRRSTSQILEILVKNANFLDQIRQINSYITVELMN